MTRVVFLKLLVFSILLSSSSGCAPKAPPVTTAHGYSVSFTVGDRNLWLGPQGGDDPRPHRTTLAVVVRDAQGQGLDGVAVEFATEPSWVDSVNIVPQHTRTQAGMSQAMLEPRMTGLLQVMAHVDGQTYTARLRVSVRNFPSAR